MSPCSVAVRANMAEDPKTQLCEEEILAEMTTLIQAGHNTTAYTLSWVLYELAAHPEDQAKVYEEISRIRMKIGAGELTHEDFDSMSHLNLVLKEAIRLHPVVPILLKEARNDDVLLLDFSVVARDGSMIDKVPVKKGQMIRADISSYNRLKAVWGEDAEEWNPNRHLGPRLDGEKQGTKQGTTVGFFANTLTFSAGPKGCLGWRFAVMEIQALLTILLERFEFSLLPNVEIEHIFLFVGINVPSVKGAEDEGAQLPLRVTLRREG
ncbi:hypothetical protein PM082_002253 [Marasmius tenuissimus]|nr:hypothetical protein PM082_002253 [Marasmius tenuissimus]